MAPNRRTILRKSLGITLALTAAGLIYEKIEGEGLRIELEGAYLSHNYRDVGQSLNKCLNEQGIDGHIYNESVFSRANKWFSGWTCSQAGNPDAIYTLNYNPDKRHSYFCRQDNGNILEAIHVNQSYEFNDLEFLKTWDDPRIRRDVCQTMYGILADIAGDQHVLIHCDAGRDRTGAMSGLIAAILTPADAMPRQKFYQALECDYRKSESLIPEKYGRIEKFISALDQRYGHPATFAEQICHFDPQLIAKARAAFMHQVIRTRSD